MNLEVTTAYFKVPYESFCAETEEKHKNVNLGWIWQLPQPILRYLMRVFLQEPKKNTKNVNQEAGL
jgi:hypothetical protein